MLGEEELNEVQTLIDDRRRMVARISIIREIGNPKIVGNTLVVLEEIVYEKEARLRVLGVLVDTRRMGNDD